MRTRLSILILASLGCSSFTYAGIKPDASQQNMPHITTNANGSMTIDINAASKNGISHNKYSQFDVNKHGVVLNNSAEGSASQLGGNIAGNGNLTGGNAKLIVNEVSSGRRSKLNGLIEVAGQKADVIIANPAGIACDGCGFINVGHSTLTTGNLKFSDDQLISINARNGKIVITGQGMNDKSDYTSLLASSVEVGAALRAKQLAITSEGIFPAIGATGLDVSALGGMYADKITLVTSNAGVGVSNNGLISAATELTINSQGQVNNHGRMETAGGALSMKAYSVDNTKGTIQSGDNLTVLADTYLNNRQGMLKGQNTLKTSSDSLDNTGGAVFAGDISIAASSVSNNHSQQFFSTQDQMWGGIRAEKNINITTGDRLENVSGAISSANGDIALVSHKQMNLERADISGKNIKLFMADSGASAEVSMDGQINATENIMLDINLPVNFLSKAKLNAGKNITLSNSLATRGDFINSGKIHADGNINYHRYNTLINRGEMLAGENINIHTTSLLNFNKIFSNNNINISASEKIFNYMGEIYSDNKATLKAPIIVTL